MYFYSLKLYKIKKQCIMNKHTLTINKIFVNKPKSML